MKGNKKGWIQRAQRRQLPRRLWHKRRRESEGDIGMLGLSAASSRRLHVRREGRGRVSRNFSTSETLKTSFHFKRQLSTFRKVFFFFFPSGGAASKRVSTQVVLKVSNLLSCAVGEGRGVGGEFKDNLQAVWFECGFCVWIKHPNWPAGEKHCSSWWKCSHSSACQHMSSELLKQLWQYVTKNYDKNQSKNWVLSEWDFKNH